MKIVLGCLVAACCFGQISVPTIGFVRDAHGSLRPLQGIEGAFVLGEAVATGVISASFNGRNGLAKTDTELLVIVDGEVLHRIAAPQGLASFGSGAKKGKPEWVRFANGECLLWKTDAPTPGPCPETPEDEFSPIRNIRLQLPQSVDAVERINQGWFVLRTSAGLYAIRTDDGHEALYALPEAAE